MKNDWYSRFRRDVTTICLIMLLLTWGLGGFDRDSTDSPEKRSDMSLHTDYLTGCEYLSVSGGGVTPRLGVDGKQLCAAAIDAPDSKR